MTLFVHFAENNAKRDLWIGKSSTELYVIQNFNCDCRRLGDGQFLSEKFVPDSVLSRNITIWRENNLRLY